MGAKRATRPGLRSLRNVRELKEGMVLTVEPGCYFIESEIAKALADPAKAPYMNAERARSMLGQVSLPPSPSLPFLSLSLPLSCLLLPPSRSRAGSLVAPVAMNAPVHEPSALRERLRMRDRHEAFPRSS